MYIFLSVLIVLISLLLIFIVTIQNSKGGGLASGFASTNNIMGVRKTTDLLEKLTWGLTGAIVVLCLISARFAPRVVDARANSAIDSYVEKATIPTPVETQPFGAEQSTPATGDSVAQ